MTDTAAFNSNTPWRIQQRKTMQDMCRQFERSPSHGNSKRLKNFLNACGQETFIEAGFYCDYGHYINLGDRVYINAKCTFLDGGVITIGNDCLIGPNVQILTINHDMNPQERLKKLSYAVDTQLGNNVWVGAGTIILPGVSIGDNTVIGAGTIITKSLPANCFAAGSPASIIRNIEHE